MGWEGGKYVEALPTHYVGWRHQGIREGQPILRWYLEGNAREIGLEVFYLGHSKYVRQSSQVKGKN